MQLPEVNIAYWEPETRISLVNVNWNSDYRDVWDFASRTELNDYINSLEVAVFTVERATYVRMNTPIMLDIPFSAALKFNYIRVHNPAQPVNGDEPKDLYYFINDVRHVAPNTTEFVLQLDAWATFKLDMQFGRCYVERGHLGIANQNAFNNYGRDYLTVSEGLDTGADYVMVHKESKPIMAYQYQEGVDINDNEATNLLVLSTVDLAADSGTLSAPVKQTAKGGKAFGMYMGASAYVWPDNNGFEIWLEAMQSKPWVTEGIVSITVIPPIRRYYPTFVFNPSIDPLALTLAPTTAPRPRLVTMKSAWRESEEILSYIPEKYRHLTKLFTYPYLTVELTTMTGNPITVRPESWADPDARVLERMNLVPPGQRVAFSPHKLNARAEAVTDNLYPGYEEYGFPYVVGGDDNGDYIDTSTVLANFPSTAILNDGAINFLAQQSYGLAYARQSADWSQQSALRAAETGYDQAGQNAATGVRAANIGRQADRGATDIANQSAMLGVSSGIAQGATGGAAGAAGAVIGGAAALTSLAATIGQNDALLANRNLASSLQTANAFENSLYLRDSNKGLADWSARGNYANTIAGIQATEKQANMVSPSVSGQAGGEAMNVVNNNVFFSARWKMLDPAAMAMVCDYWLAYGYAVRRWHNLTRLSVMEKFTYWKLLETYVTSSSVPEGYKQVIRGILEKGVTVWKHPSYIGTTDIADNKPLGGITI